jgi:putative endonuclease
MKVHKYFIYIMTNPSKTVFYTGVTNALERRVLEHQAEAEAKAARTFCGRYNIRHLLYHEEFQWIREAINREKQVKKYSRARKLELIRGMNPNLDFLDEMS